MPPPQDQGENVLNKKFPKKKCCVEICSSELLPSGKKCEHHTPPHDSSEKKCEHGADDDQEAKHCASCHDSSEWEKVLEGPELLSTFQVIATSGTFVIDKIDKEKLKPFIRNLIQKEREDVRSKAHTLHQDHLERMLRQNTAGVRTETISEVLEMLEGMKEKGTGQCDCDPCNWKCSDLPEKYNSALEEAIVKIKLKENK